MEVITDLITFRNAVYVIIVLFFIWILRLLFKKEFGQLVRVLIIFSILVFGGIFILQKDMGKSIMSQVKKIFPTKKTECNYKVRRGVKEGWKYIEYDFFDPLPKISVSLDSKGKGLHITDVSSLNNVLESLKLPKVTSGVQELVSITGSEFDANHYRWDDYPEGVLLVERTLCKDKSQLTFYHCILTIIIMKK